jgi:hypothetical protein
MTPGRASCAGSCTIGGVTSLGVEVFSWTHSRRRPVHVFRWPIGSWEGFAFTSFSYMNLHCSCLLEVGVRVQDKAALPKGKLEKAFGKRGVLFITYSLIAHNFKLSPTHSRVGQIVEWLQGDNDGNCFIVLDECHKAKNLVSTGDPTLLCGCLSQLVEHVWLSLVCLPVVLNAGGVVMCRKECWVNSHWESCGAATGPVAQCSGPLLKRHWCFRAA